MFKDLKKECWDNASTVGKVKAVFVTTCTVVLISVIVLFFLAVFIAAPETFVLAVGMVVTWYGGNGIYTLIEAARKNKSLNRAPRRW